MLLTQTRPDSTDATTAMIVPAGRTARIDRIYICNTTGSSANASLFVDAESREDTTFSENTAILFAHAVAANDSLDLECGWILQGDSVLGVTSGTADALTFTVFGELV